MGLHVPCRKGQQHTSAALSSHLAAFAPDAAADGLSDNLVVTRGAALSSIHATSVCGSVSANAAAASAPLAAASVGTNLACQKRSGG
jgi:hypothetical protein